MSKAGVAATGTYHLHAYDLIANDTSFPIQSSYSLRSCASNRPVKNTETMTISTTQSNQKPTCAVKISTSIKKARGKDAVPFEEMERLMNLYGSIKALRIRGAAKKKGSAEEGDSNKKVPVKKDSSGASE